MGSSQTRDRTCVPCIGRRIPNHCATREVQHPFLKRLSFLCFIAFAPLSKSQLAVFIWIYFWDLYSILLIYLSILSPIPQSWLLQLNSKSWSWIASVLQLCSSILCWQFWVFASPCKLRNQFVNIHKITCQDFDWDCVESTDKTVKNWHLDDIESFYSLTWNISPLI